MKPAPFEYLAPATIAETHATHAMHKMQTKGYLTRQPGNNRINVTWMEEIDESCR